MANIRKSYIMPLKAKAHQEDLAISTILVCPLHMRAKQLIRYKISFSDHARSMRNVVKHRLIPMQNKSLKSEPTSPFAAYKINIDVSRRG